MAFDIYFIRDDVVINSNNTFGGGSSMTGWSDPTGSWANGGDGVVYDGDSEQNPLAQDVTLTVGWYHLSGMAGGMSDGEYIYRVIRLADQQPIAETRSDSVAAEGNDIFYVEQAGSYQIAISATSDADSSVENVMLTVTENRVPVTYDNRYSLNYDELITNPTFAGGIGGWTDATGSWSGSNDLAIYDNDSEANLLHTSVTVPANGWYRLGIEVAAGSSIAQLYARVQGVTESLILWHDGQRESFFYLPAGTYTVDVWTSSITAGGVKLVSLMAVDKVSGKQRKHRTIAADDYLTTADELILVDTSGGDVYVYLPPLSVAPEMEVIIKKISSDSNQVVIDGDGSETIDGSASQSINVQWRSLTLVATDDNDWMITAKVT